MRLLLGLALATAPWATRSTHARELAERYPVLRVLDGDTILVGHVGRVRLLGIDAPELGFGFDTPAPFAAEARDLLVSLVEHRYVTLEGDGRRTDKYGRRLAYVIRDDGLLVNAAILRAGLARLTARRAIRRLDELRAAERSARLAGVGIWGGRPRLPQDRFTVPLRHDPPHMPQ